MAVRRYRVHIYRATRDNEWLEDITPQVRGASLRIDLDADIPWSLDITFDAEAGGVASWNYIAVEMVTQAWTPIDGETETSDQLGLFIMLPSTATHTSSMSSKRMTGYDLTWIVAQDDYPNGFSVNAGVSIIQTVQAQLDAIGLTRHLIAPSAATFTVARSWEPHTNRKTALNEMLAIAGYYRLTQDRQGRLISFPYRTLASVEPRRTIRSVDGDVNKSLTIDADPDHMWNAVEVVKPAGTEADVSVRVINDRADSPVSTANLGFTKLLPVTDSNVTDLAAATQLALLRLEEGATYIERVRVWTPPDSQFDPREVFDLDIVNDYGSQVALGRYWWDELSMDLKPRGPMEWRLNRLQPWEVVAS